MSKKEQLYNTTTAALKLGISPITVRTYVRRGLIVPSLIVGSLKLFTDSDLSQFATSRKPVGRPRKK
jgi:DNA-binding transcriptional MerR regulator